MSRWSKTSAAFVLLLVANGNLLAQQREALPSDPTPAERFNSVTRVLEMARPDDGGRNMAFFGQCKQALALKAYCTCLSRKIPSGFAFDTFIVVAARSKQENGYDKLGPIAKTSYDAIPSIRDSCAASTGAR